MSGVRPRVAALDGLRGVAILVVLAYHLLNGSGMPGGYTGVNAFFVLSGFLITGLLISEYRGSGRIDFKAFWVRRAIRLAPALIVTICAAIVLAVAGDRAAQPHETLVGVPFVILYVGNVLRAFNQNALGILGHTWSLSVEEQFYLVWPPLFVLLAVSRRRSAWKVMAVLAIIDAVWCQIETVAISEARGNFGTDTAAFALIGGCAFALWHSQRESRSTAPSNLRRLWHVLSALAAAAAAVEVFAIAETTYTMTQQMAVVSICMLVVLAQTLLAPGGPIQAVLESPAMRWLGQRSYGFYLYHYVIFQGWGSGAGGIAGVEVKVVKVLLTAAVTVASWELLETPLRRQFRQRWRRGPALATALEA
jgi:peptidoglycan/LPS O-acetylase OafA/YrhL